MTTLQKSRKQRLRACESVLKEHAEHFVKVGLALIEINKERLFEEEGFETLGSYLKANKERFGFASERYAYDVMKAAEYRGYLDDPDPSARTRNSWTEYSVRQLTLLGTPERAAKVARVVLREAAKDGVKLTALLVRRHVNAALGVKPEKKQEPVTDIFDGLIGSLQGIKTLADRIPKDAVKLFKRKRKHRAKELAAVIVGVEKSLEQIWALLP